MTAIRIQHSRDIMMLKADSALGQGFSDDAWIDQTS